MISGFATGEGTARYRARLVPPAAPGHFRSWDDLAVSSVGLGTYLGDEDDATDRAYQDAVARAVEAGFNVLDSALTYRHQRSERAVGAALHSLVAAGTAVRDEIVVATKGGLIGSAGAPDDASDYPRLLADQLDRSRANLGVETIDVYHVHNPESQLGALDRPAFLDRMRTAFAFLERAVDEGKIRRYGTATWSGYRQPASSQDFLSLSELTGLARAVAGDGHHFRVVQLPYNLAMTEAFTQVNQPLGAEVVSLLDAAQQLDVYVMTSASIYQGQLARNLPAIVAEFLPGLDTDAQRALQFVRSTPGVGTALVGMRQRRHVDENARVAGVSPLGWDQFQKLFSGS